LLLLLASMLLAPVSCDNPADSGNQTVLQEIPGSDIVWQKNFGGAGGDIAHAVQQTSDGGYVIVGFTDSWGEGSGDVYLIKTDAEGNELWYRTFGGDSTDWARSVRQTTDGGYIIAGATESFGAGNFDMYLIKTDANGNELWSATFGGSGMDDADAAFQTADGGYIIAGTIFLTSNSGSHTDIYLVMTDADGNELWSKTFGGQYRDYGGDMQPTADGGYIIAGTTGTTSKGDPGNDIYLIKTDNEGTELWSNTYGGSRREDGYSVWPTADGGYVVAGISETRRLFTKSKFDFYVIKTDSEGNELWSKTFRGKYTDFAYAVRQTSDSGYVVLGTTNIDMDFGETSGVDTDIYLLRLDARGNELWSKTYGRSDSASDREDGNAIEVTDDGGYIIVGLTVSYRSRNPAKTDFYDVYAIKTDSEGNTLPWGE
jgi:hypothetical protein